MQRAASASAVLSALAGVILSTFSLAGCGSKSPIKTHPVVGKVEIKDGDTAILAGSAVELQHEKDEDLRPTGNIDSTGKFVVKTLYKGKIIEGAPEGKYKARIILGDPSDEGVPKRKGDPIHKKYYDFTASKLTITVPGGDYNVTLSKK
jgi:predicted small lipoprotein YifL